MNILVYKVTNTLNGKTYIGQTQKTLASRKAAHLWESQKRKSCKYFHSAISKYGADSFIWEEVLSCFTESEADIQEIRLIAEANSFGSNGYNLCIGGSTNRGYKHSAATIAKKYLFKHSEETKQKARLRMLGTTVSEVTKQKLREYNLGKVIPKDVRAKISATSSNNVNTVRVLCTTTGEVYKSLNDAAEDIGVHRCTLSKAINNNTKTKSLHFTKITKEQYETCKTLQADKNISSSNL